MIDAMRWLVKDAHQHDSLFFHCECLAPVIGSNAHSSSPDSGHGSQVKDRDGDEMDGFDEGKRSTQLMIRMKYSKVCLLQ